VTPYKNKSVPMNLSINNSIKTPKDGSMIKKGIYHNGIINNKLEDRLNLSVDVGH
jgi:hypothetical protein